MRAKEIVPKDMSSLVPTPAERFPARKPESSPLLNALQKQISPECLCAFGERSGQSINTQAATSPALLLQLGQNTLLGTAIPLA